MEASQFIILIRNSATVGTKFDNPGGGKSEIVRQSDTAIYYRRGNSSNLYIKYDEAYRVWRKFQNHDISTTDLKDFMPSAFQRRHPCNCTFLFTLLQAAGLVTKIRGSGTRGDPFHVVILPEPTSLETIGV